MYSTIVSRLISQHRNHLPNCANSQSSFWKNIWVSAPQESNVLILGRFWKAQLLRTKLSNKLTILDLIKSGPMQNQPKLFDNKYPQVHTKQPFAFHCRQLRLDVQLVYHCLLHKRQILIARQVTSLPTFIAALHSGSDKLTPSRYLDFFSFSVINSWGGHRGIR